MKDPSESGGSKEFMTIDVKLQRCPEEITSDKEALRWRLSQDCVLYQAGKTPDFKSGEREVRDLPGIIYYQALTRKD